MTTKTYGYLFDSPGNTWLSTFKCGVWKRLCGRFVLVVTWLSWRVVRCRIVRFRLLGRFRLVTVALWRRMLMWCIIRMVWCRGFGRLSWCLRVVWWWFCRRLRVVVGMVMCRRRFTLIGCFRGLTCRMVVTCFRRIGRCFRGLIVVRFCFRGRLRGCRFRWMLGSCGPWRRCRFCRLTRNVVRVGCRVLIVGVGIRGLTVGRFPLNMIRGRIRRGLVWLLRSRLIVLNVVL